MDTAKNIASYMLSKEALTPKQVQKLLYYAYSLYLVKYNDKYEENKMEKLFSEKIEAWDHGPVVREVYDYIKYVALSNQLIISNKKVKLSSKRIENFIDKVLNIYGIYSGYELEQMTHSETPWKTTKRNDIISDKVIYDYYSKKYKNIDNI